VTGLAIKGANLDRADRSSISTRRRTRYSGNVVAIQGDTRIDLFDDWTVHMDEDGGPRHRSGRHGAGAPEAGRRSAKRSKSPTRARRTSAE